MTVRTFSAQKAGLTRAVRSGDPQKVRAECIRTVREWESNLGQFTHGWPDDWHRWNIALRDATGEELDYLSITL
jgi:hypothetical protein